MRLPHIRLLQWHGQRGSLEILPLGTVEREAAEKGERIYQLGDLPELLAELRDSGAPRDDLIGVEEVGAILLARAVEIGVDE